MENLTVEKRKAYIDKCAQTSLRHDIYQITPGPNIPDKLLVSYKGVKYIAYAYMLSFHDGKAIHTAVLEELKSRCIINVSLECVE